MLSLLAALFLLTGRGRYRQTNASRESTRPPNRSAFKVLWWSADWAELRSE